MNGLVLGSDGCCAAGAAGRIVVVGADEGGCAAHGRVSPMAAISTTEKDSADLKNLPFRPGAVRRDGGKQTDRSSRDAQAVRPNAPRLSAYYAPGLAAAAQLALTLIYTLCIKQCMSDEYRAALDVACREYEELGRQRAVIDARLTQLTQSIGTLIKLCGFVPTIPWGLTDACRAILRNAGVPMSPTEVRDRLAAIGFDLSKYSNELAAIHTVLRRLNESGELRFIAGPGKHLYRWNVPPRVVAIGPEVAEYLRQTGPLDTSKTPLPHPAAAKPKSRKKEDKKEDKKEEE
jgi:hypothetical protein